MLAFKLAKATLEPATIASAAGDIARLAPPMFGHVAAVTVVPCGHSRRPDCFGWRLGAAVADRLGVPFHDAWAHRPMTGSSHPTRFRYLPPLDRTSDLAAARGLVLVVDDLATSGFHMAEALADARAQGAAAAGVSWIYGTVT
ncbi:phosphoribosyltransferase [Acuticoccus mangrovi]|uniref:Phosphoribosyltransferase domain-containing protein n=1 Tax=Acuticoccus mangrovi TaxID=2796142 RepID=A0A934IG61_9HYPH|nr:phosphoribosyltransferase [Acuticoccus mangrovi]MBJ3775863.1 hypothetical protein [Acuticoccus mangrovi]